MASTTKFGIERTPTLQTTGRLGESLVANYLETLGYEILARNWRCARGEIDIVARHGDAVIAIEVKTRRGTGYGAPLEAITYLKARRLRQLLSRWLIEAQPRCRSIRVDGVGVTLRRDRHPLIEHVEGIA